MEALLGFSHLHSPGGLVTTLLSQGCVLGNGSRWGNGRQNIYSKDRGGKKEPPIAGA